MGKHTFRLASVGLLSLALLVGISGCETTSTDPAVVTVWVINSDSIPIQNALVRLHAPVSGSNVDKYRYTEPSGAAVFKYNLPSYLNITAGKGGWKGCSFVAIKPGESSSITVVLKPYGDLDNGCAP